MAALNVISGRSNGIAPASVYVFGERNSGTNFVHHLIMRNCVVPATLKAPYDAQNARNFGWKHGFPMMERGPDDVLAIAVYREPIAWLHSLCRAPWHTAHHLRGIPFSKFIRSEWQSVIDDEGFGVTRDDPQWGQELMACRDPVTGQRFANAMRLRNAKNAGLASLDHRFGNVLRLRYEEVAANPEVFLNALCRKYGFARRRSYVPIIHDRATPGRGEFVAKPVPAVQSADMDFILSELDLAQERALGYDPGHAHLHRAA